VAEIESGYPALDLSADVVALTGALVDIPSESGAEALIADLVEAALLDYPHLAVHRDGNTVVAMTDFGCAERVVIGGHLDTVPAAGNLPHHLRDDRLYGLGACDMKGGVAVGLKLAATVVNPVRDCTYVFYECEEIEGKYNGLARIAATHPQWLEADFAILMEPSNAGVEAGCQGTLRFEVKTTGRRAHSARSWLGDNAIHKVAEVLARLSRYQARTVEIDGLQYREGLNAVRIRGGTAGNVIPDEAVVTVNYRFAPSASADQALDHVRDVFDGYQVQVVEVADGALPGLSSPSVASFVRAVGAVPQPKLGWTDVARFTDLGVPALNYGPGDPNLAHTVDEYVPVAELRRCEETVAQWLVSADD